MRRSAWTTAALAFAWLASAGSAWAAPYTVHSCRAPDGTPVAAEGWTFQVTGSGKPTVDDCASGGSLRAAFDSRFPHAHSTSIAMRFEAPADTTISAYDIDRTVQLSKADDDVWAFNYGFLRDELAFRGSNQADICQPRGSTGRPPCSSREGVFSESGLAIRRFFMFTDCNHNGRNTQSDRCNPDTTSPRRGASMEVRSARIRLDDPVVPSFSGTPGGSLLDTTAPVRGVAEATFTATDRGSGLRDAVLLIDGRQAAVSRVDAAGSACQEPYVRIVPCPLESRGRLAIDTATLPDGPHDVSLQVFDATGVNVAGFGPVRITTANTPPPPAPPPPACLARPPLAVTAALSRSTIGFGSRGTFGGRVLDSGGRPAAGARVRIVDGAAPLTTAVASATGSFSVRVPAGGNRSLRAIVDVPGGLACSSTRRLNVRAGVSLSLSRRRATLGQPIRFSGRVRGPIPRQGKLVVLQVRDRGGRVQVLKNVRTSRSGRYRYTYRFRRSRGTFTYRFRAQVPRERAFPYALGYSRERKLTVRGR